MGGAGRGVSERQPVRRYTGLAAAQRGPPPTGSQREADTGNTKTHRVSVGRMPPDRSGQWNASYVYHLCTSEADRGSKRLMLQRMVPRRGLEPLVLPVS